MCAAVYAWTNAMSVMPLEQDEMWTIFSVILRSCLFLTLILNILLFICFVCFLFSNILCNSFVSFVIFETEKMPTIFYQMFPFHNWNEEWDTCIFVSLFVCFFLFTNFHICQWTFIAIIALCTVFNFLIVAEWTKFKCSSFGYSNIFEL